MTTERNQSAISEVRDQLSLDYADGEYLNVVGHNLGMNRPVFGFGDDEWRALVKAIALQYKQVTTRFHAVLSVLFGPKITQVGTLAEAVVVGDRVIKVNEASRFPQIGTIVLDEGQMTEESLEYCFINYSENEIFLASEVTAAFAHAVTDGDDVEEPIIVVNSAGLVVSLTNTRDFPTTGYPYTVVIGRGTASEETAVISSVDAEEGTLTLAVALSNTQEGLEPAVIQSSLALPYIAFSSFLTLVSSRQFPENGVVLLDVKTTEFTAVSGTVNDVTVAASTFSANVHAGMFVKFADDTATGALQGVEVEIASNTAAVITFDSALGSAPGAGDRFVVIQPPFNATAGSTTTVTVNGGTFTADFQVGNKVIFDGNVTSALEDVEATVISNTDSVLTFSAVLGTAPVSGDTFRISPRVEYTTNDVDDNILSLPFPIRDLTIPDEAIVELLATKTTAALAPVKVAGAGWDVYQVTPREVELYLPDLLQDVGDLRSASYLHIDEISPAPTDTLSSGATAGDDFIELNDFTDFPIVGVITIDLGGTDERVGYYKDGVSATGSITHTGAAILDTETFVLDDGTNPAVTFEFDDDDTVVQSLTLRKVDISTAATDNDYRDAMIAAINLAPNLTITATAGISADGVVTLTNTEGGNAGNVTITETVADAGFIVAGMSGGVDRLRLATEVLLNTYIATDTVDLYQPVHAGTTILVGDSATIADTFNGPYVYDLEEDAPTGTVALTTLSSLLPGPTTITIGTIPTRTVLEVEDATAFDKVNLPYDIVVGRDTGNRETVTVTDVNFKQRASTTISTAILSANTVNVVEVGSLGPGGTAAADFPDANGYRVLLDRGGANEEVVYVVDAIAGTPDMLILEDNTAKVHSVAETVELVSDVLSVNTLTDSHIGKIPISQRSSAITGLSPHVARFPVFGSVNIEDAEVVEPAISSFDVASAAGLSLTGGNIILNPANGVESVLDTLSADLTAGSWTVQLVDSSIFPTDFPYVVTLSKGTSIEEKALVTGNNTGLDQLTLNDGLYGVQFSHTTANVAEIIWEPGAQETVEYDSVAGTTLSFSPAIVLQSTHSPSEVVVDSSVKSDPRQDGYDFPLRMPVDIRARIDFLWDLIRAAGVRVTIIDTR